MMRAMRELGLDLRVHRERLGLSLSDASERTGLSRLRIDLIERGSAPPPSVVEQLVVGLALDRDLAGRVEKASRDWRRSQPEDWGSGVCTVVTKNFRTGGERRKEWYYFVLDRQVGPCFLEPAGVRARWVRDLIADPRIRVIVNDGVYEGVAHVSSDAAETTAVKELFKQKYGAFSDPAVEDLLNSGVAVVATDDPASIAAATTRPSAT